jgi:hypothetical protein
MAVEEPKFSVVAADGAFELRDYAATVVAEVTVSGDRDDASSAGFRLLAGYIFGGNTGRAKIAMTAPVAQRPASGEKIAMTAPGGDGQWLVQFTMPGAYGLGDLPVPDDARVRLHEVPARRVAVLKFSGLARDKAIADHTRELADILRTRGLTASGPPTLARYNPPWTPWLLRRNEIMIPVS